MLELLVGNDTAVITMLLLFITALLTKRIVPWYVYEDVVNKLKKYEDAAPELINEMNTLMEIIAQQQQQSEAIPKGPVSPRPKVKRAKEN